jgi:hypothetical protein
MFSVVFLFSTDKAIVWRKEIVTVRVVTTAGQ